MICKFRARFRDNLMAQFLRVKSDHTVRQMLCVIALAPPVVYASLVNYWWRVEILLSEGGRFPILLMLCLLVLIVQYWYLVYSSNRFYGFLLQLFLLSLLALTVSMVYSLIQLGPEAVNPQGQVDEVVSADASYIALILIYFGLYSLLLCCVTERMYEAARKVAGGFLVVVGILLPDIVHSYRLAKFVAPECMGYHHCNSIGALWILTLTQVAIAAAAALALLLAFTSVFVPMYIKRYFRGNVNSGSSDDLSSCDLCKEVKSIGGSVSAVSSFGSEGSAGSRGVPLRSMGSLEDRSVLALSLSASQGDVDDKAMSMQSEENLPSSSASVGSSGGVAVSMQLISAAVSGVVAGVCFSVVSRLFNRR